MISRFVKAAVGHLPAAAETLSRKLARKQIQAIEETGVAAAGRKGPRQQCNDRSGIAKLPTRKERTIMIEQERSVRAGINIKRARRARGLLALNTGRTQLPERDLKSALVDMLINLLHLCAAERVDIEAAVDMARQHFCGEGACAPSITDSDYFTRSAGLSTMDALAAATAQRTGWEIVKVRKAIDRHGPEKIWNAYVGPMLDRIEEEIRLGVFDAGNSGQANWLELSAPQEDRLAGRVPVQCGGHVTRERRSSGPEPDGPTDVR